MFTISKAPAQGAGASAMQADAPITVTMRANRSALSDAARTALTVVLGLAMAAAILPALRGHYLVPIYVLATMAFLVGALEWQKRAAVAEEHLALDAKAAVLTTSDGIATALPRATTQLVEVTGPSRLSLFLRSHWGSAEIARCLSLEEKQALAPFLADALRKGGGAMALKPGGNHLMLIGLGQRLAPNMRVPVTLIFKRAGKVTVELAVHSMTDAPAPTHH